MTDDNSKPVDMDNLDSFSEEFFGTSKETDKVDENEDNSLATDEDTDAAEADEGDEEPVENPDEEGDEPDSDEDEDDEEPEEEPVKAKKNRKSFQNRIDELVADKRQTQRQLEAAMKRLEELEARTEVKKTEPKPTIRDVLVEGAPDPDAVNEYGEPIYPMGEFDKNYIHDITKFTVEQEIKAAKERELQEAKAREAAQERQSLQANWREKVETAEESIPDLRESMEELVDTFQTLEPQYGEFLATTIMQCDNGPEIMYYLSQNIGEAQNIVASGPLAATLAIGKLDAKFVKQSKSEEQKSNTKQVSRAPKPPVEQTRGRGGQFSVRPDTDDLDAFEKEYFKRR